MKRTPAAGPPQFSVNVTLHAAQEQARDRIDNPDKRARSTVDYRPSTSPSRCGTCDHGTFTKGEAQGACALVAGPVQSAMTCDLYADEKSESYDETERRSLG